MNEKIAKQQWSNLIILVTFLFFIVAISIFVLRIEAQKNVDTLRNLVENKISDSMAIANKDFPNAEKPLEVKDKTASYLIYLHIANSYVLECKNLAAKEKETFFAKYLTLNPDLYKIRYDFCNQQLIGNLVYEDYFKRVKENPVEWVKTDTNEIASSAFNNDLTKVYNKMQYENEKYIKISDLFYNYKPLDSVSKNPRVIITYSLIILFGIISLIGTVLLTLNSIKHKGKKLAIKYISLMILNIIGFCLLGYVIYISLF